MVVDDNAFNMQVAEELVTLVFKAEPEKAFSGDEAFEKVMKRFEKDCCKYYKLIIMDINMPGIDGFTAARKIKDFLLRPARTRIIACTAQNHGNLFEEIAKSGMDGFIEKPI